MRKIKLLLYSLVITGLILSTGNLVLGGSFTPEAKQTTAINWPVKQDQSQVVGSDIIPSQDLTTWSKYWGNETVTTSGWTNGQIGGGVMKAVLTVGGRYKITVSGTLDGGTFSIGNAAGSATYMTASATTPFTHIVTFTAKIDTRIALYNAGAIGSQTNISSVTIQPITQEGGSLLTDVQNKNGIIKILRDKEQSLIPQRLLQFLTDIM